MGTRLRIALPLVMGFISPPLVLWEIHNENVIASVGMGWDTGAPIWPYQTSDILLRLLNGPAYCVAIPMANMMRLFGPRSFLVVCPAILLWWWFLGSLFDQGLAMAQPRWRWSALSVLSMLAVLLLLWGVAHQSFSFWFKYAEQFGRIPALLMVTRLVTPAAWCGLMVLLIVTAAKRSWAG